MVHHVLDSSIILVNVGIITLLLLLQAYYYIHEVIMRLFLWSGAM